MLVALGILAVAFVAELYVMVQVAGLIGVIPMATLLVLLCASGAWVVKFEGLIAWRSVAKAVAAGRMPTSELIDGLMILVAGALLLVPGFISGLFGLLLAIPLVRQLFRPALVTAVSAGVGRRVRFVGSNMGDSPFGWGQDREPGARRRPSRRREGDIIDLDGEEYFIDEPAGELDPGPHD